MKWGSKKEIEKRNRILISIYAYSYEFENDSLISDSEYDKLAEEINTKIGTGNRKMDLFFKLNYTPDSGMWIRNHPDLEGLRRIYRKYYKL